MSNLFKFTGFFTFFLLIISTTVADVDFEKDVSLIIAKRCLECHNATEPKGGLDLSTLPGLTKGGDTGPAVVSGDSNTSYLIERINNGEMPPPAKGESQKLPEQEINILVSWIDSGVTWPIGRTLDIYEREGLLNRASGEIGQYFEQGLHSLKDIDSIIDIRNYGLIGAVQFAEASHGKPIGFDILKRCYDKGVMVRSMGNTIALSPPLIIEKHHIDLIVDTLGQVAKELTHS